MKALLTAFALWALGSYGVYRLGKYLHASPWWIVVYAAATIALFIWLVVRANKKNTPATQYPYSPTREDSV